MAENSKVFRAKTQLFPPFHPEIEAMLKKHPRYFTVFYKQQPDITPHIETEDAAESGEEKTSGRGRPKGK